jgi:dTDP-4-dehydrorhamnose 3,5-epimerase-like enzyme
MKTSITDCKIIELPKFGDRNGYITSVNNFAEVPFEVNRVFYLYDIPGGESRGAHAHINCHQFLISASGSFEVLVDDGIQKKTYFLNRPNHGLYIPPEIWASENNFSSGSICLVLASHPYLEDDYIRDYNIYLDRINK